MNYQFPRIDSIEQVRAAIKDRPQFIECDKGDYIVFNYVLSGLETFPPLDPNNSRELNEELALIRELRGLVFYPNGQVASRRLHKFFNLGERVDTMPDKIDLSKPHVVLQKLDGSMITPLILDGKVHWATKMGLTDVATPVRDFVLNTRRFHQYENFAKDCYIEKITPIFEWISRKQRIVLDYPQDKLVLIAMRFNKTGQYLRYDNVKFFGELPEYNIPVVKALDTFHSSVEELAAFTKGLIDQEGFVIRFDDGHMIKVKSEWYCALHTAKSMIDDERKVIRLVIENHLDDLKGSLQECDLARVNKLEQDFVRHIDQLTLDMKNLMIVCQNDHDRKSFALNIAPDMNRFYRQVAFRGWDDHNFIDGFLNVVKNNLSSGSKYQEMKRVLFPDLEYKYIEADGD